MVGTGVFNMGSGYFMGADNQMISFAAEYASPPPNTNSLFFLLLGIDRGLLDTLALLLLFE